MAQAKEPEFPPGTVSNILWHFTGGPKWDEAKECQGTEPKPDAEAYENLVSIIKSRTLNLGSYRERFHAAWAEQLGPGMGGVESEPVCCLADIPAQHLGYHAYRYGKFAIGFHRESAVTHGFAPVLYSLSDAHAAALVWLALRTLDTLAESHAAEDLLARSPDWSELDVELAVKTAHSALKRLAPLVKTFDKHEFSTVYCEREWRSTKAFSFNWKNDVAMIVLPQRGADGKDYYAQFHRHVLPKLPKRPHPRVPIVRWDLLVGK